MHDQNPPKVAWVTLVAVGALTVLMGSAFVVLRPVVVLLPEDQRYTGMTPEELRSLHPALFHWMGLVFTSWGAFAIGLGIAIAGLAGFSYRGGDIWAERILFVTGVFTFGIFLSVNLLLGSDFGLFIAILLIAYMAALARGRLSRARRRDPGPGSTSNT
ncbi:hypothetical protein DAD99_18560 [Pseudarthrobacter sp. AB1]|nr:hypothetical protein [Pseudarthrobacter sp. AB1]